MINFSEIEDILVEVWLEFLPSTEVTTSSHFYNPTPKRSKPFYCPSPA